MKGLFPDELHLYSCPRRKLVGEKGSPHSARQEKTSLRTDVLTSRSLDGMDTGVAIAQKLSRANYWLLPATDFFPLCTDATYQHHISACHIPRLEMGEDTIFPSPQ